MQVAGLTRPTSVSEAAAIAPEPGMACKAQRRKTGWPVVLTQRETKWAERPDGLASSRPASRAPAMPLRLVFTRVVKVSFCS